MKKPTINKDLKWALSYLKPYILPLTGIFILTFAQNYTFTLLPKVGTNFLFELLSPEKIQLLVKYLVLVLVIIFAKSFLSFFRGYSVKVVINTVMKKIRDRIFFHLLTLDLDFFAENKTGDIIAVTINDVTRVKAGFYLGIIRFLSQIMMVIIILVKLFLLNWRLTLISFGATPFIIWIIRVIGNKMRVVSRRVRKNVAELSINLHETVTGIEVVKAYAQEEYELDNFKKTTKRFKRNNLKLSLLRHFFSPLNEIIIYFFAMVIIAVGSYFIIKGSLKPKQLIEFMILMGIMSGPLMKIPSFITRFKVVTASIERILNFLETKPKIQEIENPIEKVLVGKIEFKNVWFSYNPSQTVLKDVSYVAERGEVVALVGPSGAGKTTIANLIPRFYEYEKGEILIDDTIIKNYGLKSLRSQIGIVSQNVILFNTSIFENIRYSMRDATEEEIISVTKQAYAYDFIMQFPDHFHTEVGEKGVKLSGGQKQRIAIARTFLMNPQILILDEATSSLDSESEYYIRLAIEELMKGRTSIIIAHRLSTISHAKKILVLNEGQIIDIGTHDELIKRCEMYNKIYKLQYFR